MESVIKCKLTWVRSVEYAEHRAVSFFEFPRFNCFDATLNSQKNQNFWLAIPFKYSDQQFHAHFEDESRIKARITNKKFLL